MSIVKEDSSLPLLPEVNLRLPSAFLEEPLIVLSRFLIPFFSSLVTLGLINLSMFLNPSVRVNKIPTFLRKS